VAKSKAGNSDTEVLDVLRDILIATLGVAGAKPAEIRKIVGCGMAKVTRVTRSLKGQNRGKI
jgi:hypothetical protein